MPTDELRNVLLVMAIHGLRPEELVHLTPKVSPTTGKLQLWCRDRKAAGGRTTKTETKPRWLQAIPLRKPDGEDYPAGELAAEINTGLMLFPALKDCGTAVAQYVKRMRDWKELAKTFAEQRSGCALIRPGTPIQCAATFGAFLGRQWRWPWSTAPRHIRPTMRLLWSKALQNCLSGYWGPRQWQRVKSRCSTHRSTGTLQENTNLKK